VRRWKALPFVGRERTLHEQVRSAWDQLSEFWDERMQAGETWQGHLIQPAVQRLLALQQRERVLEIACGNGEFARHMAELGARVLAVDFSEGMLDRARGHGGDIEYALADATDEQALLKLGDAASFDAVASNMAIMDMESIEPMVSAASVCSNPAPGSYSRCCILRLTRERAADGRNRPRGRYSRRVLREGVFLRTALSEQGNRAARAACATMVLPPPVITHLSAVLRPRLRLGWS
jgi:SAM-dependent methyltransferase